MRPAGLICLAHGGAACRRKTAARKVVFMAVNISDTRRFVMTSKRMRVWIVIGVLFSDVTAMMSAAQDKYTVKVPGGLAFSEFRGYESWQAISISRNERVVAVILGNPAMIDAYRTGIPGNGKPFPDGAKMAKVHWAPKQN